MRYESKGFEERCIDFDIFSRSIMGSNDIDPSYLVIKELNRKHNYNEFWYTFCYVNYYDMYSGMELLKYFPTPESWNEKDFIKINNEKKFHFCPERKGNSRRVDVQTRSFKEFLEFYFSECFLLAIQDVRLMRRELMSLHNQGGWSAYKIIEVLQKSFGYENLAPPDCNMEIYSSNINTTYGAFGVKFLFGLEHNYGKEFIPVWENLAQHLAKAYNTDAGEIETCWCKYAKLGKGIYYVGHDIYEHHELKHYIPEDDYVKIMSKHFDERFWKQPRLYKEHKQTYKEKGIVVWGDEFCKTKDFVDVYDIIKQTI